VNRARKPDTLPAQAWGRFRGCRRASIHLLGHVGGVEGPGLGDSVLADLEHGGGILPGLGRYALSGRTFALLLPPFRHPLPGHRLELRQRPCCCDRPLRRREIEGRGSRPLCGG
jgi:hypothetical protein